MPLPTPGQLQGLNELSRIIEISGGGLEMEGEPDLTEDGAWLDADLRVDGAGTFRGETDGLQLGKREPFTVCIPAEFPFKPPAVFVGTDRFAGLPHVQWGRWLCLYASANDWEPSDGMWGFIERLLTWYLRAARGRLVDAALPWHPPVTHWAGIDRKSVV